MSIIEDIAHISDIATRERKLENDIIKMQNEWKNLKFEMTDYKLSGGYVLIGIQPIWDLLDEHI